MIRVEGYLAFRGVMRITPKSERLAPFELEGDWLYKPETGCWYGCGRSFGSSVCKIIKDKGDYKE